jgi:hypothetical protein
MRNLRLALEGERPLVFQQIRLLEEFDERRRRKRRTAPLRWAWSAAAALLLAAVIGVWRPGPPLAAGGADSTEALEDFVPVPFSPPLATGESVQVVRLELTGAELARMGIELPGGYGEEFDADVVLSEDGLPRAVRLLEFDEL